MVNITTSLNRYTSFLQQSSLLLILLCCLGWQQANAQCAISPTVGPYAVTINVGPGGTAILNQAAVTGIINPVDGAIPCAAGCTLEFSSIPGGPYSPAINLSCDGSTPDGSGTYYVVAKIGLLCSSAEVTLSVTLNDVADPIISNSGNGPDCGETVMLDTDKDYIYTVAAPSSGVSASYDCRSAIILRTTDFTDNCAVDSVAICFRAEGSPAPLSLPSNINYGPNTTPIPTLPNIILPSTYFYGSGTSVSAKTRVTYKIFDAAGNVDSCHIIIQVNDNEAPAINCPTNKVVNTSDDGAGDCTYTFSPVGTSAISVSEANPATPTPAVGEYSDNCPNTTVEYRVKPNGGVFTAWTAGNDAAAYGAFDHNMSPYDIEYRIDDAAGNGPVSCGPFTVTVNDDEAPVAECFPIPLATAFTFMTDEDGAGDCSVVPNNIGPGTPLKFTDVGPGAPGGPLAQGQAYDNCDPLMIEYQLSGATSTGGRVLGNDAGVEAFNAGQTVVQYFFNDADGGTAETSCVFIVDVKDNEAPDTPVCPANITTNVTPGTCEKLVSFNPPPSFNDNCTLTSVVMEIEDPDGNTGTISTFETDPVGCSSVNGFLDAYLPGNWTQTLIGGDAVTHNSSTLNITGSSNTSGLTSVSIVAPNAGFMTFDFSASGGTLFELALITINGVPTYVYVGAGIPPLTGSRAIAVQAGDNIAFQVFSNGNANTTNLIISNFTFTCAGNSVTGSFPVGTSTVTYTVSDGATPPNTSMCSFTVTVNDNEAPTAVCQDITVQLDATGNASIAPGQLDGGSTDNCPGGLTFSASQTSFDCTDLAGPVSVTLTVEDVATNSDTCHANVTVEDNIAPVITCPGNQTISANASCTNTLGDWTGSASATDNCGSGNVTITQSPAAGTLLSGHGDVETVTLTATDASGNTDVCTFNVTLVDATLPTFTGCPPADITANADANCVATPTWTEPSFSDNCGVTVVKSHIPGTSTFPLGTTVVTYTGTDPAGNTATCSFNVVVSDNTKPTITCPPNANFPSICTTAIIGDYRPDVIAGDNCDNALTLTQVPAPTDALSAIFGTGAYNDVDVSGDISVGDQVTITVTATDNNSNSEFCSFVLTLQDTDNPIAQQGNPSGGDQLNPFTVTACGGDYTLLLAPNVPGVPFALDNCGGNTILGQITPTSYTDPGGGITANGNGTFTFYTPGVYDIDWLYCDASNNCITQRQIITIEADTEAPMCMAQPAPIAKTLSATFPGTATLTALEVDNGSTDNCAIASYMIAFDINGDGDDNDGEVYATSLTLDCSHAGLNVPVLLKVTDNYTPSPNSSICSAVVSVSDLTDPTFTCVGNQVRNTNTGVCTFTMLSTAWDPTNRTDNCGVASTTHDYGPAPSNTTLQNAVFPEGTTTVTWTITDVNGRTNTCSFDVTVEDNELPTLDCPSNATRGIADDGTPNNCFYTASAGEFDYSNPDDNCGVLSVTHDFGAAPLNTTLNGADFPIGTTTVTWTITDINSNTNTCSFDVTVEDDVAPFASCINGFTLSYTNAPINIPAGLVDGGSFDGCSGISSITLFRDINKTMPAVFDCDDADNTTQWPLFLFVEDGAGNEAVCQTYVIIQDLVTPTAICQNATVQLDASGNGTLDAELDLDNGSTDNCPGNLTYEVAVDINNDGDANDGEVFAPTLNLDCTDVGTVEVLLRVSDLNNNSSLCSALVTVEDNVAPTALCQNVTVQLDAFGNGSTSAAAVNNGSNDACGIASLSLSKTTFDCGDVGNNNLVVLTVTDVNGNVSTCTAFVTVEDNVAPTALCQDVTVQLDANGDASVSAGAVNNGSNDACGISSLSVSPSTFDCSNLGANPVTLTVTDNNGNVSTCSATVTVEDNIVPVVTCVNHTAQLDASGNVTIIVNDVLDTESDNCDVTQLQLSQTQFDCSHVGVNFITLTATDQSGNTGDCTAAVTIEDNVPPTIITKDITINLDAGGNASILASDVDNGTFDACGLLSLTVAPNTFNCSNTGPNTVVLTATDVNGNVSTGTATVTVLDIIPPTVVCNDITVTLDANEMYTLTQAEIDGLGAGSTDACGAIASFSVDRATFDCNDVNDPPSPVQIILTVTDNSGNTATCTPNVTVETVPNTVGLTVGMESGMPGATVWVPITVTDFNSVAGIGPLFLSIGDLSIATFTGNVMAGPNLPDPGNLLSLLVGDDLSIIWNISGGNPPANLVDGDVAVLVEVTLVGNPFEMTPVEIDNVVVGQSICGNIINANVNTTNGKVEILDGPPTFDVEGDIARTDGARIGGVDVDGTPGNASTTDNVSDPSYSFTFDSGDNVTITPTKTADNDDGVNIIDLLIVQQEVLVPGTITDDYKLLAANANKDASINIIDLIVIQNVILTGGIDGFFGSDSWEFVDADYVFTNPLTDIYPENIVIPAISADDLMADFVAVKMGDVDCSGPTAFTSQPGTQTRSGEILNFLVDDIRLVQGQTYRIPFRSDNFEQVKGYQFTLDFDPAAMRYKGYDDGVIDGLTNDNFGLAHLDEGQLTTLWFDVTKAVNANTEDAIFYLEFEALQNGRLSDLMTINSEVVEALASVYDQPWSVELGFSGTTSTNAPEAFAFQLFQNQPNPFRNQTVIRFTLPSSGKAVLSITDVAGKVVKMIDGDFDKGVNEVTIDNGDLGADGVYYYQLQSNDHIATRKMILFNK